MKIYWNWKLIGRIGIGSPIVLPTSREHHCFIVTQKSIISYRITDLYRNSFKKFIARDPIDTKLKI
ncbi:hypothetical protein Glove_22g198 [Diversispora epigaea]|uniref:Uncharacterized protein n=1 Tax=Diversispora epigaea TaxID=1348612 RepID=A0A397JMC6_9GLOM|nr:hypothetical protein Glove_22g198 [Diversispora epigaea]